MATSLAAPPLAVPTLGLLFLFVILGSPSFAQSAGGSHVAAIDEGVWHPLSVTGGRVALASLGVADRRERAAVMVELVRRLHFSVNAPTELEAALLQLSRALDDLMKLQGAIALSSTPDGPPTLRMATGRPSRKRLEAALAAAGLDLEQSRRQYHVEPMKGSGPAALRSRLKSVGVDVEWLRERVNNGDGFTIDVPSLTLPLPLSPATWSKVVFERDIPPPRLFVEILGNPAARLLYHGLAGLDAETRRWIGSQPDLLRRLYRDQDAIRSFALFAPAVRVASGRVVVPGGATAEQRWSATLDASIAQPDRFVRRLFDHNNGRTAGVYFTIAAVDSSRQSFLLSASDASDAGNKRFGRLVSSFANCYPSNSTASYPFALRSYDAALLLLEVGITGAGVAAGPPWRRFWELVLQGDDLTGDPASDVKQLHEDGPIDAAWMVDTLCAASAPDRASVFATFLAGHRVFAGIADADLPDALVALRARRLYPAVFMALEHADIRQSRTYAAVARHAAQLARLDDPARGIVALRLFQGALALTLNAVAANTLTVAEAEALLESLAAVPFEDDRYDGRFADWFERRWLPAVQGAAAGAESAEDAVARALAGPADVPLRRVRWEGLDYVVDVAGTARQRLRDVRQRQGGPTLDSVVELNRIANLSRQPGMTAGQRSALKTRLETVASRLRGMKIAEEFAGDAPNLESTLSDAIGELARIDSSRAQTRAAAGAADLGRTVDFVFSHVLASWAYAPHVGEADSAALVGGDGSLRHDLGLRSPGREKFEQRWRLAVGDRGGISGSLLGLEAALAMWSLRRLSSDAVPAPPTIGGNDLISLMLTAALSDSRRLTDDELERIATASENGSMAIEHARGDPARLASIAATAAVSPWRREALSWIVAEEPDRLDEQFSITERARLGGLRADGARAWGTVSIVTGCLCLQMPPVRIPEVIIGRAADGIVGGQSADLMLRVAHILTELKMPAALAAPVLRYAMRAFLDEVRPLHTADFEAFARQARALDRRSVEDYLGAIAAVGPLRPAPAQR